MFLFLLLRTNIYVQIKAHLLNKRFSPHSCTAFNREFSALVAAAADVVVIVVVATLTLHINNKNNKKNINKVSQNGGATKTK